MRILIRTSKWAIWARRFASLAIPLLVIPVLLHRQALILTDTFHIMGLVGFAVAVLAFVLSVIALARLWHTGDQGWGRAIGAFVISGLLLSPFVWALAQVERFPMTNDISTADRSRLALTVDDLTANMRPPIILDTPTQERVFPNARTREYPLTTAQAYEVVLRLIEQSGWSIRTRRAPTSALGEGSATARIMTLLGWRDEVVFRIAPSPIGATIDMRSVSLNAQFDLGTNGQRVEAFLVALDAEITILLRDNPNITEPIEDLPETELAPVPETDV